MSFLASWPTIGIIDDSNILTLSWSPAPSGSSDSSGSFSTYDHWNITVDSSLYPYRFPTTGSVSNPSLTQIFTQTLGTGEHTISMQAFDNASPATAITQPWQTNGNPSPLSFPTSLNQQSVTLSLTSVLLGQTLSVILDSGYNGADQWQVIWLAPDGTKASDSGWLPLSASVVAKSFSIPGVQNILVQTRKNYSGSQYNPPVSLIRQTVKQIFVIDQQDSSVISQQGGLVGDLGVGGQQVFEIVGTTGTSMTPNPWEVITRGFVLDEITNELKLIVATSRFSNASSLLGTMAIDVFPIQGRPHSLQLIEPVYQMQTTSNTGSNPVQIQSTSIPTLIVGKSVAQAFGGQFALTVKDGTGIGPYLWSAVGLPSGVTISSNGTFKGTPLTLGTFNVTFAVQDSGVPFSIDEVTFPMVIATDLVVQIGVGQVDARNTLLSYSGNTLGAVQVGKIYSVQMAVGNTNPTATTPGGLAPYQWSIPVVNSLPIGLSIDQNSGIISGIPCTYNSTTDYHKVYSVLVQVIDAIGAKATHNYTMSLIPAPLQFGPVDQKIIYSAQDFKLAVPIFGGQSPYQFNGFQADLRDTSYYITPPTSSTPFIDGQMEVMVNAPTTATANGGNHAFSLNAQDSLGTLVAAQINYQVLTEISDIRLVPAFVNHIWTAGDNSTAPPLAISGDLSGYLLSGTTLVLTAAANHVAGSTLYTGVIGNSLYVGQSLTIQGFSNTNNNGAFICTAATPTTITLSNPNGVAEVATGKAILNLTQTWMNGISVAVDAAAKQIDVTGPITLFRSSRLRIPITLTNSGTTIAVISRDYEILCTDDSANPGDIGTTLIYPQPYIVGEVVALNPRKPHVNSPNIASFRQTPNTNWTARLQTNSPLPPGLSLDANTGLIYGTLGGLATALSIIEYVDGGGTIHGNVSINWTTYKNDFNAIDNFTVSKVDGQVIGKSFNSSSVIIKAPVGTTLSSPVSMWNDLPAGVSLGINGQGDVIFTGTPTEAGYFDLWIKVTGNNTQYFYLYHRLAIDYTKPMSILTTSLPTISAQPYTDYRTGLPVVLQGYGGIPPYTWSSSPLPAGLVLTSNANNTGTLSGTLTNPPTVSPTNLGFITFILTDTRGSDAAFSQVIGSDRSLPYGPPSLPSPAPLPGPPYGLIYDNRLRIMTPIVPVIIPGDDYGFSMLGAGGVPPYTWQIANSPTLLSGIVFDALETSYGPTGAFSGTYSPPTPTPYDELIQIKIKDQPGTISSGYFLSGNPYDIKTGERNLNIDSTNIKLIPRGVPYQGTLTVVGIYTAPITWQIAPIATHPNLILPGLLINSDISTLGVNAIISGTYSGAPLTGDTYKVRVVAIDSKGEMAVALVPLNTGTDLTITTLSLPNAMVGGSYVDSLGNSVSLSASGGVPPYTWLVDSSSTDNLTSGGISLSTSGVLSGVAAGVFTKNLIFKVTDSLAGIPNTALGHLSIISQASGLGIVTNIITPATSGRDYSFQLQAGGSLYPTYTWAIVGGSLPTGLSLDNNTGIISGNTKATSFSQDITFRVYDGIRNSADKSLNVSVIAGLTLVSGIDFTAGTTTGILGYIARGQVESIAPRPNLSFYVIAQGVISSAPEQISVSISTSSITANVESITAGVARIKLSGPAFSAGSINNTLSIVVTDSGVNMTASFTWVVFDDGILRTPTLPTQLATP